MAKRNQTDGEKRAAAVRKAFPEAYYVGGIGWCGPQWQEAQDLHNQLMKEAGF